MHDLHTKAAPVLVSAAALFLGACATSNDGVVGDVAASYDAVLSGEGVVGAGDPDGFATAQVIVKQNEGAVCYNVWNVRNIGTPTGAHIHRGTATENGPVIAPLEQGSGTGWNGCVTSTELVRDMLRAGPESFYIQVHTTEYPRGAIRGQLSYD